MTAITSPADPLVSLASPSLASQQAAENVARNVQALSLTQPALAARIRERGQESGMNWTFARDGALTARDDMGKWYGGCSVPRAGSRAMLKTMDSAAGTACFLRPFHAAAVGAALEAMPLNQAMLVILPEDRALHVLLHCEDFSADIERHRLWLIAGGDWETQLAALLEREPGLPTPTRFIRLRDGREELADAMVEPAQRVISEQASARSRRLSSLHAASGQQAAVKALVIAPSSFTPWEDAPHVLRTMAVQMGVDCFDSDDPRTASTLALAERVARCSAIVSANISRRDAPGAADADVPWVTWVTNGRIPTPDSASRRDALLVVDPRWRQSALALGWPAERVHVAAWPEAHCAAASGAAEHITLIAGVSSLSPPAEVIDLSSHRLMWDCIARELTSDPFAIRDGVAAYLDRWLHRSDIDPQSLNRRRFVEDLVIPAYCRGLLHALLKAGFSMRVFGRGWEDDRQANPGTPLATRAAFEAAVDTSAVLLHAWPIDEVHPIERYPRPLIGRCRSLAGLLDQARRALSGRLVTPPPKTAPPLTADLLARLLAA